MAPLAWLTLFYNILECAAFLCEASRLLNDEVILYTICTAGLLTAQMTQDQEDQDWVGVHGGSAVGEVSAR